MQESPHVLENPAADLEVVPLGRDRYADWDSFCLKSSDAWFWHTTQWMEYTLHYRPELNPRSESFFCLHNGRVAAICPLIVENDAAGSMASEFSYGADAVPAPAFAGDLPEKVRRAAVQATFAHIDELAEKLNIARASFRVSPLVASFWSDPLPRANPLAKLGFNDISLATQVLDLAGNEQDILRQMRKGHRADIARAAGLMEVSVLDRSSITAESFERYRLLHRKAAGRVTRPLETFQMMHDWIRAGQAILCVVTMERKDVGFSLISVYKDGAYYSSSCEDPEFNHLPIGHLLQWRTIQWLKQHGIRQYEIGIQQFTSQFHSHTSEKERKIAFFKRGFGGQTVPFWRGEKFYDREYCLRVLRDRATQYAESVAIRKRRVVV